MIHPKANGLDKYHPKEESITEMIQGTWHIESVALDQDEPPSS